MRETRTIQASIFEYDPEQEIGRELKAMSEWLDENLALLDWMAADVKNRNVEETGRKGLTIDSVSCCALLKQYRQLSYEGCAPGTSPTVCVGIGSRQRVRHVDASGAK
jgi:IS5 family transposase